MLKLSRKPIRIRPTKTKVRLEVGCRYKIKTEKSLNDCYPWFGGYVPVFVLGEYATYYHVVVLEHYNPSTIFGMSQPYEVTIDKFDLNTGRIKVK